MDLALSNRDLSEDDPFLIAAVPSSDPHAYPDESWEFQFWSKAKVIAVIVGVARAYKARFPELVLAQHRRSLFNHLQAEAVAREVEFVGEVLNDAVVSTHCRTIASLAARVAASNGKLILVLEGQ